MAVWSLARKEFQLLIRERGTFFWLILLPILFMVVFGAVFGKIGHGGLTVPYVDLDRSAQSQQFLRTVAKYGGLHLQAQLPSSLSDQIKRIEEGKQTLLIVVPKGFGQAVQMGGVGPASHPGDTGAAHTAAGPAGTGRAAHGNAAGQTAKTHAVPATAAYAPVRVTLYRDAGADQTAAPVLAVLNAAADQYRAHEIAYILGQHGVPQAVVAQMLSGPFAVTDRPVNAKSFDMLGQIVPGYTVMFSFYVMISIVRRFLQDRETGMAARMLCSRLIPWQYLAGMWLPYCVVVCVQCAVLLTFGRAVFGVHLGDIAAIAALIIAIALCVTSFGVALAMSVKSENQGNAWTQLFSLGGAMVGGLWFPADMMPHTMQVIGHCTPQYWAQQGMQDVMIRGAHLANIGSSVGILLAFAAVAFVIALWRFPRFMRSAVS